MSKQVDLNCNTAAAKSVVAAFVYISINPLYSSVRRPPPIAPPAPCCTVFRQRGLNAQRWVLDLPATSWQLLLLCSCCFHIVIVEDDTTTGSIFALAYPRITCAVTRSPLHGDAGAPIAARCPPPAAGGLVPSGTKLSSARSVTLGGIFAHASGLMIARIVRRWRRNAGACAPVDKRTPPTGVVMLHLPQLLAERARVAAEAAAAVLQCIHWASRPVSTSFCGLGVIPYLRLRCCLAKHDAE